jgi:hypothetical protein
METRVSARESHCGSEKHCIEERENNFVRRFQASLAWPSDKEQRKSDNIRMVSSNGLQQGKGKGKDIPITGRGGP